MKTTLLTLILASNGLCADLPTAETLFQRYVEATGGQTAYTALKSQVVTGTMEFLGQGLTGKLSSWVATPGPSPHHSRPPRHRKDRKWHGRRPGLAELGHAGGSADEGR
jgi:hypothetical protein